MRTSALLTLFFSFFFVIDMAFCLPLSLPDSDYALVTRDTLGSQSQRDMNPVAGPIEQFLRKLGKPGLREIQSQVGDYCSKFSCRKPSECK
ncbi:hypothetical protein DFH29DRAFT_564652 [Suillus ampliporus]|nr:hypothetical protein DFH29DRAFT_564652 [Suillus ampliporus]